MPVAVRTIVFFAFAALGGVAAAALVHNWRTPHWDYRDVAIVLFALVLFVGGVITFLRSGGTKLLSVAFCFAIGAVMLGGEIFHVATINYLSCEALFHPRHGSSRVPDRCVDFPAPPAARS